MRKLINKINKPSVSLRRNRGESLEIILDLHKIFNGSAPTNGDSDGDSRILRRIVLGRGLQYYMCGSEKFQSGDELLMKLRDASNELQLVSNNLYVTGRAMQQDFTNSVNEFDRIMMQVIRFIDSVEGGREELMELYGVDVNEIKKNFCQVHKKKSRRKILVFKMLL